MCVCFTAGISVSNLTDSIIVFHITCEDPKQKVCGHMLHIILECGDKTLKCLYITRYSWMYMFVSGRSRAAVWLFVRTFNQTLCNRKQTKRSQSGSGQVRCPHVDSKHASKCQNVSVIIPSIKIEIQMGKENAVDFSVGQEPMTYKAKNGHLMVVRRTVLFWKWSP